MDFNSIKNYLSGQYKQFKNKINPTNNPSNIIATEPQQIIPTQTPQPINITIPGDNGDYRLPNRNNNPNNQLTAEDLYETFDPYGLATESARMLKHPNQQTRTLEEIKRLGESWNRGENPEFSTGEMKAPNPDGTYDFGPMRINDHSFNEMLNRPNVSYWKNAAKRRGISGMEDIKSNTKKNLEAALLVLLDRNFSTYQKEMEKQGTGTPNLSGKVNWDRWYAADPELRNR